MAICQEGVSGSKGVTGQSVFAQRRLAMCGGGRMAKLFNAHMTPRRLEVLGAIDLIRPLLAPNADEYSNEQIADASACVARIGGANMRSKLYFSANWNVPRRWRR